MKAKTVRCAIYTRKSTEHNLDLEFNSLHAQREACEAYIKSQMHEGWQLIPDCYDDGGISGASLDRPDLQRLLNDISAGRVDNVVVYKVDRLTRSLTDFAKLVELFDKYNVSFVSVTQAFNTTTSMGRLTLNVLLSFAQFEREVIGERVRDKIAASKKKGLFMGGNIPFGYINRDKKLVVIPEEAERIRWIFQRYLELGSLGTLLEEMYRLGHRTKIITLANGRKRGGVAFGRGALAHLLKNRCYVGELTHRGQIHAADHEAIIERETFDAVQSRLNGNSIERRAIAKTSAFLLAGLIFDSAGNRMTPSHSRKKGVRYRYYISQAILQCRKDQAGQVARAPAPDIESLVWGPVARRAGMAGTAPSREVLEASIYKVTVQAEAVEVALKPAQKTGNQPSDDVPEIVSLPWVRKPSVATKGIVPPSLAGSNRTDSRLVLAAIGKARLWIDELTADTCLDDIARREDCGQRQIRALIPLAFLPPPTVKGLIDGSIPVPTVTALSRSVPLMWPVASLDAGP